MKRKKLKSTRIVISLLLTISLVLSSIPMGVVAFAQEDQTLMDQLMNQYSDDDEMLQTIETLNEWNLLDEDLNFNTQQTLLVDGVEMTLDEARALIASGVDSDIPIIVGGMEITLGDLAIMLEIEEEIAFIRSVLESSSGVEMTEEHYQSLMSLQNQLENEGLPLLLQDTADDIWLEVSQNSDTLLIQIPDEIYDSLPDDFSCTFDWSVLAGTTDRNLRYTIREGYTSSTQTLAGGTASGTVTLTKLEDSAAITLQSGTGYPGIPTNARETWFIQIYNPQGAYLNLTQSSQGGIGNEQCLTFFYGLEVKNLFSATGSLHGGEPVEVISYQFLRDGGGFAYAWTRDYEFVMSAMSFGHSSGFNWDFRNFCSVVFGDGDYTLDFDLEFTMRNGSQYGAVANSSQYPGPWDETNPPASITSYTVTHQEGESTVTDADIYTVDGLFAESSFKAGQGVYPDSDPALDYHISAKGVVIEDAVEKYDTDYGLFRNFPFICFGTLTRGYVNQTVVRRSDFTVTDEYLIPEVTGVRVPAGEYVTGTVVPIIVSYSVPMVAPEIIVNGVTLTPLENEDFSGNYAGAVAGRFSYAYVVQNMDDTSLNITAIGGKSFTGETLEDTVTRTIDDVNLVSALLSNAPTGMALDASVYSPAQSSGTITASLDQQTGYKQKYADDYDINDSGRQSNSFYAELDGARIPLYYEIEGETWYLTGTFDLPAVATQNKDYTVYLYAVDDTDPVQVLSKTFTRAGQENVKSDEIEIIYPASWPSGTAYTIYLVEENETVLNYRYTGDNQPTPTFIWESLNPDIATVAPVTGSDTAIAIQPLSEGTAQFTVTCQDGGGASQTTAEITIAGGGPPQLVIPTGANTVSIQQGQTANVRWATNIFDFNEVKNPELATEFTIELFTGNKALAELSSATCIYTGTVTVEPRAQRVTNYSIPGNYLIDISVGDTPSYTVRVRAPHPEKPEVVLEAVCYIQIISQPAQVKLANLDQYYILDNVGAVNIGWTMDYIDSNNGAEAVFEVTWGDGTIVKQTLGDMSHTGGQQYIGGYQLGISTVTSGTLKDIYTVSLKAKNTADGSWSYDSYVLHVYSSGALDILVNGASVPSLTMSNLEWIESLTLDSSITAKDLAELRRDTNLQNIVSANYGAYAWSQLNDRIAWNSSDSNTASVNYRQGSLYENIERFSMSAYLPETEFILSGLKDGEVDVTATHAATGMTDTMRVKVETLKDKLYLFQFSPMIQTTLHYVNGMGETRNLKTNSEGALAVYEPSGIVGEIQLESKDSEGNLYLGTLRQNELISGERDGTKLEMYPQNVFKLRQAARADLFLKNQDGTPYQGQVTLRGGVLINEAYKQVELLANSTNAGDFADGEQDIVTTVGSDGRLTIMVSMDDLNGITYQDKLQFIYELRFENDMFRPELVYLNGNLNYLDSVRLGDRVIALTPVATGEGGKPYLCYQTADYQRQSAIVESVMNFTGYVGPGLSYPLVEVQSKMVMWGMNIDHSATYQLLFADHFGVIPGAAVQTSKLTMYPFSTIAVMENTLTLKNDKQVNATKLWWDTEKDKRARSMSLQIMEGGEMRYSLPISWRVIDMTHVEEVEKSDSVTALLGTLNISRIVNQVLGDGATAGKISGLAEKGVSGMVNLTGEGDYFKTLISPTNDPTVFTAYIWAGKNGPKFEEKSSGVYTEFDYLSLDSNYIPTAEEWTQIAQGGSAKVAVNKAQKLYDEAKGDSYDIDFHLNGYYKAQISYNFDEAQWEMCVLGGGFSAGIGLEGEYEVYTQAGPVPVAAYIRGAAYLTFSLDNAVLYVPQDGFPWNESADRVNDFLFTLRLNGYIRAFGGLGVDMSIVAFRIGVFGQMNVDFVSKWLTRTYLADAGQHNINGQYLDIKGTVGLECMFKFLIFKTEVVLVSFGVGGASRFNQWDAIGNYWANATSGLGARGYTLGYDEASSLVTISSPLTLEGRDYLDEYSRTWYGGGTGIRLFSLDTSNGLAALQDNAYPYTDPYLSADGEILVYVSDGNSSDIADMQVMWSKKSGDAYLQGNPIVPANAAQSYGVSSLSFDGDSGFAAAAWVYEKETLTKGAGEELTADEQAILMSGSEIMAAIYDRGQWHYEKITDNATPDLAPVVAVNDNGRIFVAWRNVYASDSENPTTIARDSILYRVYDGNNWSEIKNLYNGGAGQVYALSAAMLPDGTSAVSYVLNNPDELVLNAGESGSEVVYAVVDENNEQIKNVRLTSNRSLDENPKLTTVNFGSGDDRFVLGWHSNDGYDDIGLACFDKEGTLENTFIESLSSLATSGKMELSGDFRFARMDGAVNSIENLSVLWTEPVADELQSETTLYYDVLKAARFVEYNGVYTLSAPSEIASMNERPAGGEEKSTTVDHFDAYVATDDGATIKAVILGSEFDGTFRVIDALTGMEVDPLSVEPDYLYNIFVPNTQSKLFTATGVYENRIDVPAVSYDYETLMTDILMTLSFTVENLGCEPITDISININNTGDTLVTKSEFILLPNQSHTFSIDYKVGSKIEDLSYTITAGFAKGGKDTYDGEVFMEIHDVGISQMRTVSEQDGIREVEVLLYNMSEIPLKGSGKTVRLGIFEDAAYTTLISDIDRQMGDEAISITDDTSLGLIDEGAYVLRFTFNIANYLKNNGGYEEIPESERYLFSKCWIEEADGTENYEYYQANNTAYIGFDSLLIRNGNAPVTLTSAMSNDNDASTVSVRLQNNSLRQKSEGNLIALLLDGEGNIIESMQSYNALGGYISLTGEGIYDMEFHFSKLGAAAHMAYSDFVLGDNSNANLSVLTFSGIPVDLSDFENSSNVSYTGGFSGNLLVTAIAEDPNATVTITANGSVVPSYDGAATLNISSGRTPLTVTVTAVDKTTKTYALDIDNGSGGGSSGGGSSTTTGTVTFDTNGGSKISSKSVTFGETISKPTDPTKEGFTFAGWYTDAALTQTFDFNTKITKNTTIYAKWTEYLAYEGWLNPFIDVKESDWFYDSVKFAHQNGLFSGTSTTTFSPSNTMTRGMMVTGLWRLGGSPTVGSPAAGSAAFTDVPTGAWYADAVNWAAANGIVSGVGGNLFAPNDEITREQMAVMLNNYAKFVDAELPKEREGVFADEDKISSWAKEAVNAMYAAKILNGKGANDFDPQGRATRAEVAEMFKRFIEAAVSFQSGNYTGNYYAKPKVH